MHQSKALAMHLSSANRKSCDWEYVGLQSIQSHRSLMAVLLVRAIITNLKLSDALVHEIQLDFTDFDSLKTALLTVS